MLPAGFEPTISGGEQPQVYATNEDTCLLFPHRNIENFEQLGYSQSVFFTK